MDVFRTEVFPPEYSFKIEHGQHVFLIGSCFAENMGGKLSDSKIKTTLNPFGILFNPFSIMNALERMLNNRPYDASELVTSNDHFASLDHHGRFNALDKEIVLQSINEQLEKGRKAIFEADTLFITLGSAWVYEHIQKQKIVANCHKIQNNEFVKKLLTYQEIHLILRHIPQFLKAKGIDAQIVFTLSPVRHWKDGPIQNQRSKSLLNAAVHAVVDEFESCHYFPAYEMVMDDLRDYRFFAADMLHLNEQAIDYVWQKFQEAFFTAKTREICNAVKAVVQAANHRPIDPESNSFQRFLLKQIALIDELENKYKALDMKSERAVFQRYLI